MFNNLSYLLIATLSMSVPFIFAATGGVFSAKSGVMALGLESMMMVGAFFAVVGSYYSNNVVIGLISAILGGGLIAFFYAVLSIRYRVNQVIAGIGLNMFALAATTLFTELIWGSKTNSAQVVSLDVNLDFFNKIPFIGKVIGSQSILFLIAIVVVVLSWLLIFKTTFGLRLRTVGEAPQAAATMGIKVSSIRYKCVVLCGMLAGLGGAYLSVDNLNMFQKNMTAGRGYIAVAIAILSRYNPAYVAVFAILFGITDALQIYLQGRGIPADLLQTIPYVTTLLVLTFGVKYIKPPAGLGKHEN